MASRRVYYTRYNLDPKPVVIVDNLDRIVNKNKKVESSGNKNSLIKADSLPNKLSILQDLEFGLNLSNICLELNQKVTYIIV